MNQVPKIPTSAPARTVAGIPVPPASRWLVEAMADLSTPHPDVGRDLAAIRPGVRQEAARVAAGIAPLLVPATEAQWASFLLPLRVLPGAPSSRDGLDAQAKVFAFAMNDVPACVLTANYQREALRSIRFWPTPHDLDKVLRGAVNALKAEYRSLTLVAKAPEATQRTDMPDADRERIAAGLAALRAELEAKVETAKPSSRPAHLSPAHLAAARAKAGITA